RLRRARNLRWSLVTRLSSLRRKRWQPEPPGNRNCHGLIPIGAICPVASSRGQGSARPDRLVDGGLGYQQVDTTGADRDAGRAQGATRKGDAGIPLAVRVGGDAIAEHGDRRAQDDEGDVTDQAVEALRPTLAEAPK